MPPEPAASECIELLAHSRVKVEENGRSATVLNLENGKIRRIKVDGCLITIGPRCDWILSIPYDADILIELKGTDVTHALEQLEATLRIWQKHSERAPGSFITLLIVCSQYPKFDTRVQRARQRFRKEFQVPLHIRTRNQEFDCRDLKVAGH